LAGKKVVIEYSSPNTNKPQHLGHCRNNLLGQTIATVLQRAGADVVRVNLVNDRGIHICKSMVAWQKIGNGETPATSGMKGDHLVGKYYVAFDQAYRQEMESLKSAGHSEEEAKTKAPILLEAQAMLRKWEEGDPATLELWRTMNSWVYTGFEATYRRLGVSFDKNYYESDTYVLGKKDVERGLELGVFYRKEDGSVWIDLRPDGLDEKVVLRKDGTSVYMTQDLGTAVQRFEDFNIDSLTYVPSRHSWGRSYSKKMDGRNK
jgi:arginyl-tRNA synthetase